MTSPTPGPDEARHELYGMMREDLPFERKAELALELGRRYLGVENGHVTRIDADSDYWKAVASTDPVDGRFPPGLVIDLGTSYCRRTIARDEPVALHSASEQGWADDPAYETHGLECYHGTTITLDDDAYGTVCFVSRGAREEPFDDDETMFAELIARMLEHELERRRTDARVAQLDEFASVVSHDLRSPLTVIRGWVQIAEEEADVGYLERVHPEIDRMERLLSDVLAAAPGGRTIGDLKPVSLEAVAHEA